MSSFEADRPAFGAVHSNWVVQKFGGTSVGKFALNIIEQVVQYALPLHPPPGR
jgi:aspartate kinase